MSRLLISSLSMLWAFAPVAGTAADAPALAVTMTTPDHGRTVAFVLTPNLEKSSLSLEYSVLEGRNRSETTRKFDRDVLAELEKTWGKPGFQIGELVSDPDCIQRTTWVLVRTGLKRTICVSRPALKRLYRLQEALQALLRGT